MSRCGRTCALIVALLSTPIGAFVCGGIACLGTPDPAIAGYWRAPSLFITVLSRPWAVLDCDLLETLTARGETWQRWACA